MTIHEKTLDETAKPPGSPVHGSTDPEFQSSDAPSPAADRAAERPAKERFGPWLCIALAVLAVVAAGVVHELVPNDVENLGSFLFALVPFVLAAEAVARFPQAWRAVSWVPASLATATFAVVMGGFAPLMFGSVVDNDFDRFYGQMRILVVFLILALALGIRLGGATAGQVRRASYACLLVMLSGLEDLMFQVWRGSEIPDQWGWAEHMTVRLGHVASQNEAFAFIGVHLVLALVVLFVPLRRKSRS